MLNYFTTLDHFCWRLLTAVRRMPRENNNKFKPCLLRLWPAAANAVRLLKMALPHIIIMLIGFYYKGHLILHKSMQ